MSAITRIDGRGLPLEGPNVDTDRIIPARFLRTVSFDGLERHVFEDDRAAAAASGARHPFDDPRFTGAVVLIVNENFGCGSSREHAPQALYRWGIRAVIGQSFSEIFFGNALMLGMPCVTAGGPAVIALQQAVQARPAASIAIDLDRLTCVVDEGEPFAIQMPPNAREALVTGAWDATAALLDDARAIDRTADALPYVRGF